MTKCFSAQYGWSYVGEGIGQADKKFLFDERISLLIHITARREIDYADLRNGKFQLITFSNIFRRWLMSGWEKNPNSNGSSNKWNLTEKMLPRWSKEAKKKEEMCPLTSTINRFRIYMLMRFIYTNNKTRWITSLKWKLLNERKCLKPRGFIFYGS